MFGALRGADVIHCHQQHVVASSAAALFGRLTGRPVFVSELGGGGWDVSAYVGTDRWYTGHLHISAYSRHIAGHDGKPWARVILGGVDTVKFSPDRAIPRAATALFVGRLLPHKGVDDLIRGAPADLPVEIVGPAGDSRYLADLRVLAEGKNVRFRHDCDDAALVEAYRRAACVVLPSVYRGMYGGETTVPELLGQTLLEGMACGAPTLATRVASFPEVVDEGVTGFLVPPNDPGALGERLGWMRDHPTEAAAMGAAGRARVLERFTWGGVVARCLAAYAEARA
jgi:glycosyltransferase involved in cell wall biosynthesis